MLPTYAISPKFSKTLLEFFAKSSPTLYIGSVLTFVILEHHILARLLFCSFVRVERLPLQGDLECVSNCTLQLE